MSKSSHKTVEELASEKSLPLDKVFALLGEAGIHVNDPKHQLTEAEIDAMLKHHYLKTSELKSKTASTSNKLSISSRKITLTRQKTSELKITNSSGKKTTVPVIVKTKKVYIKVPPKEAEIAIPPAEELTIENNSLGDNSKSIEVNVLETVNTDNIVSSVDSLKEELSSNEVSVHKESSANEEITKNNLEVGLKENLKDKEIKALTLP